MQLNVENKNEKPKIGTQSLSLWEEERLKKRLALLEDMRDGKEIVQGVAYDPRNPKKLDEEIESIKKELDMRSVKAAVGSDRQEVVRELKSLEEDLRKNMPTWDHYVGTRRRDGIAYVKLVNSIIQNESDPIRRKKIHRWKFLRRRLDPTNPYIANTMYLFEGSEY